MEPSRRVLIVEDDAHIAELLRMHLRDEGYAVEHAADGHEGMRRLEEGGWDALVLDLMLPGVDGLEICKRARGMARYTPIIITSARSSEVHRILGLELGADDYICKPFAPREVVARVKAVLRRSAGPGPAQQCLTLLPEQGRAMLNGSALPLTKRELTLLQALMRQPGRLYSRAQLLELACADTLDVNERAIDSHIKNLRKKLKAADDRHEWIRSVYGVGFAFEPDGGAQTRVDC